MMQNLKDETGKRKTKWLAAGIQAQERQKNCRELCGNCYTDTGYIYVNDLGVPYQPNYLTQHFKILLRNKGLRIIRFHDLRHPNVKPKTKNFYSLLRINGQASGHIVAYFLPASHPAKLHDRLEFVVMIVIQKEGIFFDGSALS